MSSSRHRQCHQSLSHFGKYKSSLPSRAFLNWSYRFSFGKTISACVVVSFGQTSMANNGKNTRRKKRWMDKFSLLTWRENIIEDIKIDDILECFFLGILFLLERISNVFTYRLARSYSCLHVDAIQAGEKMRLALCKCRNLFGYLTCPQYARLFVLTSKTERSDEDP